MLWRVAADYAAQERGLTLDPEEVAEAARELSWRHPEARGGRR